MKDRPPVVAAIPNYNMGQQLKDLLPELSKQNYADIFVLDDASTDDSREVVEGFNRGSSGVRFVTHAENRGSGSARNLIIDALGYSAIIHFLDADVSLQTERVVEVAHDIMPIEPAGFIGGLVLSSEGIQSAWNYGPRQGLRADLKASLIQNRIASLISSNPDEARALRRRFGNLLSDWPDPFSEPLRRQVFWNIEGNLLIQSDVFAKLGGFDEKLREHEIQDLAIRLNERKLERYFDPSIEVVHKNEQNVREYNRLLAMLKAELYINRKHGLRNWIKG